MLSDGALFAANVVPAVRRRISESVATIYPGYSRMLGLDPDEPGAIYNPRDIQLEQVSGGFNSILQFSSGYALKSAHHELTPRALGTGIDASQMRSFLDAREDRFETETLNRLRSNPRHDRYYYLNLDFTPRSLHFRDPRRVVITYSILSVLNELEISEAPMPGTSPPATEKTFDVLSRATLVEAGGIAGIRGNVALTSIGAARGSGTRNSRLLAEIMARLPDSQPLITASGVRLGEFTLTISAPYRLDLNVARKQAAVVADLRSADVSVGMPEGDARRFFTHFFAARGLRLEQHLCTATHLHLTPVVSLVGPSAASDPISELDHFQAEAFHVEGRPSQALSIAFTIRPDLVTDASEVTHFIGDFDYGSISDDFVIERVFKNKWRSGGFLRTFQTQATIRVRSGADEQDARVEGTFALDTLEFALIDTDSNLRQDCLKIGGRATSRPIRIWLVRDGRWLTADELRHFDLGDATVPWLIPTEIVVVPSWSPNPVIREFQIRAKEDAVQPFALPFRTSVDETVVPLLYARMSSRSRRILFLGNIVRPFV